MLPDASARSRWDQYCRRRLRKHRAMLVTKPCAMAGEEEAEVWVVAGMEESSALRAAALGVGWVGKGGKG